MYNETCLQTLFMAEESAVHERNVLSKGMQIKRPMSEIPTFTRHGEMENISKRGLGERTPCVLGGKENYNIRVTT